MMQNLLSIRDKLRQILAPAFVGLFGALVYLCGTTWLRYQEIEKELAAREQQSLILLQSIGRQELNKSAAALCLLLIVLIIYLIVAERHSSAYLKTSRATQAELGRQAEKMQVLAKQARKASEAKSEFLAMMSHDIRTPMNAIIGYSDILRETKLDEEQTSYVSAMMTAGENMLGLINDILDLTRLETGKMELRSVDFSPMHLFKSLDNVIRVIAAKNGNKVVIHVDERLADGMRADKDRLNQVLINLAGNAAKFTSNGVITLSAHLTSDMQAVRFSVADTGEGIPEDMVQRLFQPFEQGENGRAAGNNSNGLGLAISDRIVRLMGGEIMFDTGPKSGTTFSFDLPFALPANEWVPACPLPDAFSSMPLAGRRVLVADDTPANLMVATAMFERAGMIVSAVSNGKSVIDAMSAHDYDLIFIDIQMPDLSGIEVAQQIRSMTDTAASTPLIALTAQSFPRERERALANGFDAFLSKPIRAHELLECAQSILDNTPKLKNAPCVDHRAAGLNRQSFDELAEAIGPSLMPQLVSRFERDVNEQIELLMRHHIDPSSAEVTKSAHKLVGLLSQFGVVHAAKYARCVEIGDPESRSPDDLERVADAARNGLQDLRKIMRESQSPVYTAAA